MKNGLLERALRCFIIALLAPLALAAEAQNTVYEEWRTVASLGAAAPLERDVTLTVPGNYEVVLTDLGALATPAAPLASVHVAVTQGSTVLGTPLAAAGTLTFSVAAGTEFTYTVRVTGAPGNVPGSGLVRIQVRPAGGGAALLDTIDVLAAPAAAPADNKFVFDAGITVPAAGTYDVALRDLTWPRNFSTLIMALIEEGGPLIATFNAATSNPHLQVVTLDATRRYHLFSIAVPDVATADAGGLYSIEVRASGGGAAVFDRTVPIGGVAALGSAQLAAGAHELVVTDLNFPAALTRAGAHLVHDGQSVAARLATGTSAFAAGAGTYTLFGFGTPAATPAAGSLRAEVRPVGAAPALSAAHVATLAGSGVDAYLFDGPITAGSFRLRLADYQFPEAFTSVTAAATQGAALASGTLTGPGSVDLTATTGRVQVLVFARATATGGLFGIDLAPAAGTGPVPIEITQGVGRAFSARKISINADGRYDVDLTDLGFPAQFSDLAASVTRGADRVGFIFGGGRFSFAATRGNYFVNFIATPSASANAGTYALRVLDSPPAPVLTFAASQGSVRSGNTAELNWAATNATACTASNGWSGARAASGSERTATLSATATFTLSCSGAGGTVAQTITVEVTPGSGGGGGGGGGSLEWLTIVLLAGVALCCRPRRARGRVSTG